MAYLKGKPAPNRGIPHREETRKKMRESYIRSGVGKWNIGDKHAEDTKKHMSEAQKKYLQSPEGKERIKQLRKVLQDYYKTHTHWNKGLRCSVSIKERIRQFSSDFAAKTAAFGIAVDLYSFQKIVCAFAYE